MVLTNNTARCYNKSAEKFLEDFMEKQTVLAQLKKYIAGQWGETHKTLAAQLMNLTESDIVFADPTYIFGCDIKYSCTGRGCIIEENEERHFPLTKSFGASFELYKGDGAAVERYHKDSDFSDILKAWPYQEDYIVDLLEHDAYKKLNSEFSMYNAIGERLYTKINDYECTEQTVVQCPYTPIYAILKDSNGQSKQQLIGYLKTENEVENLEIDIDTKQNNNPKTMGCLFIGLGLLFPPLLIVYAIYWLVKKK